jgi:sulfonate transport system permease protein
MIFFDLADLSQIVVVGAAVGYSRRAGEYLDPTLQALKAVPSLAWVPLFILWFGIFEVSKVVLSAVGVFFPVYLNLLAGIRSTDRKVVEVGRVNALGRFDLVTRVLVPAALPNYITGLRAGLALGWMFVIAAELMGASKGLGFLMLDGKMTGRSATIVAVLILFAIAGKALEHGVGRAERVGELTVREIVKAGCGRQIGSLCHGVPSVAWVRAASVTQTPWRPDYFVIPLIHEQVNTGYPKKERARSSGNDWAW